MPARRGSNSIEDAELYEELRDEGPELISTLRDH
jgi:hypothetical protein